MLLVGRPKRTLSWFLNRALFPRRIIQPNFSIQSTSSCHALGDAAERRHVCIDTDLPLHGGKAPDRDHSVPPHQHRADRALWAHDIGWGQRE